MAACKELLRCSLIPIPSSLLLHSSQNKLYFSTPAFNSSKKSRSMKSVRTPVAALSDDILRLVAPGKPAEKLNVRATVTVRKKHKEDLREAIASPLDALSENLGRNVVLELLSTQINPRTGKAKRSGNVAIKSWYEKKRKSKGERVTYTVEFGIDTAFGEPGAITVGNRHTREFFLESIVVEGFRGSPLHFPCNSWVQTTGDHPGNRIFFSNKLLLSPHLLLNPPRETYLPSETPEGLKELREEELQELRGDGKGIRRLSDRIYDYAVYNDLGNPDIGSEFVRPTLGGSKMPYPRRCRTGRPPTDTNMLAESRLEKPHPIYVPRDEAFEELKQNSFSAGRLRAVLHNLIPTLIASISGDDNDFTTFHEIDSLYKEGLLLKLGLQDHLMQKIPLVRKIQHSTEGLLRYDTPHILHRDKFAWLRDDEFGRQVVAGINPINIEKVQAFPVKSKLDPEVYGLPESAIIEEHIVGNLNGMTVQQAVEEGKLFMLDYNDIYLPFVARINAMDHRKSYATRTIFFLTPLGTLKPIAIELNLPPATPGSPRESQVLMPPCDATTNWLWQLAKAHVCANDAGVHQLVNHWLRTHATMEPFILAAHRQMSAMHPVFKLLDPHMRYTLEINALARQGLINAEGIIESCFTPGPYCMEMSADYYRRFWRFDLEGLPADLKRRGMAVDDPTRPHGLRLLIEDYPYANDGLLIWSAIEKWVQSYIQAYYPDATRVRSDSELQSWYRESINVGHGDKRHAPWWPPLNTPSDLASILTTLIWLASAQHAALNFGQYPLGGYVPNRPPLLRRLVPNSGRDRKEYADFLADPHRFFLTAMPSVLQSTKYMAVADTLSTHSPDEEYLGDRHQPDTWTADEVVIQAFKKFKAKMVWIEEEIRRRNAESGRRNRCGAGVMPYELLVPRSEPGVTGQGVPNSVSI